MRTAIIAAAAFGFAGSAVAAESKPLVTGLKNPRAVAVGPDRRVYATVCDDPEKSGTGSVMAIENGQAVPFATGLDRPHYLVGWQNWLFVTDKAGIWRIDRKGNAEPFVKLSDLTDNHVGGICVDERGFLYVTAAGMSVDQAAVYRILPRGKVDKVPTPKDVQFADAGIAMDGMSHLLFFDRAGVLLRLNLADGSTNSLTGAGRRLATDPVSIAVQPGPGRGGIAWDHNGRLYLTGRAVVAEVIDRPGELPYPTEYRIDSAGGPCLSPDGRSILVPDTKSGTIVSVPTGHPAKPVDESPLPFATKVAFPDLRWSGWTGETPAGKPNPLRPLVLTHANDNSGRNFVATQHGVIHVFPNDQAAKKTKVFLDISEKVRYDDKSNEEGFLGLAFHPEYKRTGELFVFYTERTPGHNNVLSRFRVSKGDPDGADPASEEVLLRVPHKYWNHDGGTVIFGPDGYLYLALGDGGAANDPDRNGPNLGTLLGKIIRIDVNRRDGDKPYGIPKDNPIVGRADTRPEIYAYGLRNVWRMAFDRPTGRLWAADVGQNIYEEINLVEKGGNYGWSYREGLHPFSAKGVGPRPDLIEPIWEYDHEVGKSITGGAVYRGSQFPELTGMYLYADYVSGKIWALRYDDKQKRVVANRPIREPNVPIMSFGEDNRGELYFMTYSPSGRGIYRFVRDKATAIGKAAP